MPMVFADPSKEFLQFAAQQAAVYRQYAALIVTALFDEQSGLGGKLLFADDLATQTALLRAANIAGAASLAATRDAEAARAALRNGVIDFLVTSLDEALRILKNEIRKRQPVSVGVTAGVDNMVAEMLERGVLPDLLAASACDSRSAARFREQGSQMLKTMVFTEGSYLAWSVNQAGTPQLASIDGIARELLPPGEIARDRWLRLAPRYLGRAALRQHGLALDVTEARSFREKVEGLAATSDDGAAEPVALMLGATDLAV